MLSVGRMTAKLYIVSVKLARGPLQKSNKDTVMEGRNEETNS